MKIKTYLILKLPIVFCMIATVFFVGCMADEKYSLSPAARLSFSVDTLNFDTVISNQGTHTMDFEVYNHNSKGLRIARVALAGGGESRFRVNVNGTPILENMPTDFQLRAKDSMKVFLEMTPPKNNNDRPVKVSDEVQFLLESGVMQSIPLVAYGQDVEPIRDGLVINSDTVFDLMRPYQIFDSIVVEKGATLQLAAGVRLYFHAGARLIVRGRLVAHGTLAQPIVMRGDRLGNIFTNQSYDKLPGQWDGVYFGADSYENELDYCDVHGTSNGVVCDSSNLLRDKIRITNSVLHNSNNNALQLIHCKSFVANTQITNAKHDCVQLVGGHHQFVHCTIGAFYSFDVRSGVALRFTNESNGSACPLEAANFQNCIITGYSEDEITAEPREDDETTPFLYYFQNCLLDTPQADDENHISNCFWDNAEYAVCREQNFYPRFDLDKLNYTFTLDSLSQAVGNADPTIASQFPVDRLGQSRVGNVLPDIGCYQSKVH